MDVNFMRSPDISARLASVRTKIAAWHGTIYTKIVQALLYAVVVLLPLFYLPFTTAILDYNKLMLLVLAMAIGLVIWLLGVVVSGTLTVRTSPIDKGVYAVLFVSAVASMLSLTPMKSIFGTSASLSSALISVAALSAFYFLAVNTLHDRGRMLRSALMSSVTLALVIGVCQMLAWHFLPGAFTHSRGFTTAGSLNTLGLLAAVSLPLFAKTNPRRSRILMAVALIGALAGLFVLAVLNWWVLWAITAAGMIALIGFDSMNATQLAKDYRSRSKRWALSRFIIPVTVLVLGAFLLLVKFSPTALKSHLPSEITPSYGLSIQISKEVMNERLVTGYGPENFTLAFDKFGASKLSGTQFSNLKFTDAASAVFTNSVEMGALGLLAFALVLASLGHVIARFGTAISESVARGEGASFAFESSGVLAAAVALTAGLFLYPANLTVVFVWYALLVLAALSVAGEQSSTIDIEERPMYSLAASLSFIVVLILVLSGLYLFTIRYLADTYYARAIQAPTTARAAEILGKSISLNDTNDQYLRDGSQVQLALLRDEIAKKEVATDTGRATRIQDLISASVQMAQRATTVQSLESLNWNNLGGVYQSLTGVVNDVEQLAEDAFTHAASLRPGDASFDNQIGVMWLNRADLLRQLARGNANATALNAQATQALDKAEAAFKRAIDRAPTFGLAIYNLGMVYDRQGKVSEAIKQLETIAPDNANDANLMFQLGLLYIRAGRKAEATAAMQRAILLSPNYADARWYLALLLEEKGDIDGALAQLLEIQKNNKDNQILAQEITKLQAGQRSIPPGKVIDKKPLQ